MKQYTGIPIAVCCLLLLWGCKQETIIGEKATGNEPFKVYFLNAGVINGLTTAGMAIDPAAKTAGFPVQIFRGGQAGSVPFAVHVAADNSSIPALIRSGDLPANTVALDQNGYTFDSEVKLSVVNDMMKGSVVPRVKIGDLGPYVGKTIALGFRLTGTERYAINAAMDRVVLYFNVNDLAGAIGFVASENENNAVVNVLQSGFTVDNAAHTVNVPVAIRRPGIADLGSFTVDAVTDNSTIEGLKQSGVLPANTVVLSAADYILDPEVTLTGTADGIGGQAIARIKTASLNQYSGKKAAVGLKLTNPSQFTVDGTKDRAILYFDVDSLLDETVPPSNLLTNSGWQVLKINNDNNVTFTVNPDGSIKAAGGNWGHTGVYQAVPVKAGRKYRIDLHVKGSGATDVWYEVYVGIAAPVQGSDYSSGGIRLALNTWTGCGKSPFDGQLSAIACVDSNKGVFTASASGTMYVVIKSGGANLGTDGITASAIDFRRVP